MHILHKTLKLCNIKVVDMDRIEVMQIILANVQIMPGKIAYIYFQISTSMLGTSKGYIYILLMQA